MDNLKWKKIESWKMDIKFFLGSTFVGAQKGGMLKSSAFRPPPSFQQFTKHKVKGKLKKVKSV